MDISGILNEWDYDPENSVRIITADDGRSVLQVRQPMGIEQYELDGRPDGRESFGHATVLEEVEARLSAWVSEHGSDDGFMIGREDAARLQGEGVMFYYRYYLLFQLNDFPRVARDTSHNLRLCDLMDRYCEHEEDRISVLQYRPYILRMHAMALSMEAVQQNLVEQAVSTLERAIDEIEELEDIPTPPFQFERPRSASYLRAALEQVRENYAGPREKLEQELETALGEENYERAAEIRDRLKELE